MYGEMYDLSKSILEQAKQHRIVQNQWMKAKIKYAVSLYHVNQTNNAINMLLELYSIIPNIKIENLRGKQTQYSISHNLKISNESFYEYHNNRKSKQNFEKSLIAVPLG